MIESKVSQERMLATIKKHGKLIELAKRLNSLGKIAEIIFSNISEIVREDERILLCYYQLQTSEGSPERGELPQFYSCELHLLTDRNYINLGFFQTFHSVDIKTIDNISQLSIRTSFGSVYDVDNETENDENIFSPSQIKIIFEFSDSKGEKVANWDIDTSAIENIQSILPQARAFLKYVGTPLSKIQV